MRLVREESADARRLLILSTGRSKLLLEFLEGPLEDSFDLACIGSSRPGDGKGESDAPLWDDESCVLVFLSRSEGLDCEVEGP